MNEQMQKELMARLDAIAAKLGVAAEHVWRIMVKQGWVEGVTYGGGVLLGVVLLLISYRAARSLMANTKKWERDDDEIVFVVHLFAALGGGTFGFVLLCVCFSDAMTGLFNPEYMALKSLFSLLK